MSDDDTYSLEKPVWTEADFDQMNWHDATVWSIQLNTETAELALDIDYMFQWVHPETHQDDFRFWIAPATMVFHGVYGLRVHMEEDWELWDIDLLEMVGHVCRLEDRVTEYRYCVELFSGHIHLIANGYSLFARRPPVCLSRQQLRLEERGGISFDREFHAG